MKRAFITNLLVGLVTIGVLVTIVIVAYSFISDQILKKNIGDELKIVQNTTVYSIETKLESDYDYLEAKINELTSTITDEEQEVRVNKKLEALEAYKNQILFFEGIESGFGAYVSRYDKNNYYINNIYYQDINATYIDLNDTDTFTIINFGNPEECKVDEGKTSEFDDKPFVVFKFGEIIVYFDAEVYFNELYKATDLIEFENLFIMYPDGKSVYQKEGTKIGPFYQMLKAEFTETGIVDDVHKALNPESGEVGLVSISDIRYKNETCYLLASNLSTDKYQTELCLVLLVSFDRVTKPIYQAVVPLVAAFSVVIVVVILFLGGSYIFLSKKSNDIDLMVYQRYNDKIYKMKVNKNGKILSMNSNFRKLLLNPSEFTSVNDFIYKENYNDYVIAVFTQKPLTIKLLPQQVNGGETVYLRCIVLRFFGNYIMTCINATSDEALNNSYLNLALYNPVTQLPNEALFKKDIAKYIDQINTKKNRGLISLVFIKLKNHQSLQKFYGKFIGDEIIIKGKEKLESLIDPRVMSLYYVDEATFALAIDDLEKYEQVLDFAKFLTDEFKKPIEVKRNRFPLDLTFAVYNLDLETFTTEDPEDIYNSLVKLNDKVQGSHISNVEVYSLAIERFVSSEKVLEQDLGYAIENNEFEMYLQPQYNVSEKVICGGELLIRWNNPKYYHQSPLQYIEYAERNGLITQLTKFINESAMKTAKALEKYNIEVSVNVSPAQLLEAGFVNGLLEAAKKYEVDTTKVALEITETFLMENFELVIEKLKVLRKEGFMIHLDDFCTGYSSMLYLKELPITAIKIDREFTRSLNNDTYSRAIVNKIASLATSLELGIIAEGVEDEKQMAFLAKNNCNIIQGFLISKALPINKCIELIEGYNVTHTLSVGQNKNKK